MISFRVAFVGQDGRICYSGKWQTSHDDYAWQEALCWIFVRESGSLKFSPDYSLDWKILPVLLISLLSSQTTSPPLETSIAFNNLIQSSWWHHCMLRLFVIKHVVATRATASPISTIENVLVPHKKLLIPLGNLLHVRPCQTPRPCRQIRFF